MAVLEDTNRYRVESFGNGLFVILTRHEDGATLLLQDDDAGEFMERWDTLEARGLIDPAAFAAQADRLVGEYDHVMLEKD